MNAQSRTLYEEEVENGFTLRVRLRFDRGGISFFDYKDRPRGYYVSAEVFRREVRPGSIVEHHGLFSGSPNLQQFLQAGQRFNARILGSLEKEPVHQQIIETVKRETRRRHRSSQGLPVEPEAVAQ